MSIETSFLGLGRHFCNFMQFKFSTTVFSLSKTFLFWEIIALKTTWKRSKCHFPSLFSLLWVLLFLCISSVVQLLSNEGHGKTELFSSKIDSSFMTCHPKHLQAFCCIGWVVFCSDTSATASYCFSCVSCCWKIFIFSSQLIRLNIKKLHLRNLLSICKFWLRLAKMDLHTRCLMFLIPFQNSQN